MRRCDIKKTCVCGRLFLTGSRTQMKCDKCIMCHRLESISRDAVVVCKECDKLSSSAAKNSNGFCTNCNQHHIHAPPPVWTLSAVCNKCNCTFIGEGPNCNLCSVVISECIFSSCVKCSVISLRLTNDVGEMTLMRELQPYYTCTECLPRIL